jgi:guanyl-specific ribonuclease Sa
MWVRVSSAVAALAFLLVFCWAFVGPARVAPVSPPAPQTSEPEAALSPVASGLRSLGDAALDVQVRQVVESMDRDGRPPERVAQGGRRGGRKGVFENAERRLPVRSRGYYTESDVWPRSSGGRGRERLIFGREGEVYYSADHYRTFVRLR